MDAPLGIFDSGVGGLSVLREIRQRLPAENLLYIADSRHVPYGNKPATFIIERSRVLAKFLLEQPCKALVIACNTATASAARGLRAEFPNVPIIGMEPAVKPAAAASAHRIIGVLATVGTLQSAQFAALLAKFTAGVRVITQPAPGLVECVEAGALHTAATRALVARFVQPLLDAGADTIVLGCTHYPFLRPLIAAIAGPQVTLIDTGPAVAAEVARRLTDAAILNNNTHPGTAHFYATSPPTPAAWDALWPDHGPVVEVGC